MAFMNAKFACAIGLASIMGLSDANAAEVEYLVMQEFTQACPTDTGSMEAMKARFIGLEWSETEDKDIRDISTPDDIFGNAKIDTAFEVELSNGGYWFGGVGTAKIQRQKTVFCMLTFYGTKTDSLPIESDFGIIYSEKPEIVEGNGERRLVKEIASGRGAAIHQQVAVPGEEDLVMFRTFNVMPKTKK